MTSTPTNGPAQFLRALTPAAVIGLDRANAGPPAKVLADAARAAIRARAGHIPPPTTAQLPPCPADLTPPAKPSASNILARILTDPDAALLEEWSTLAQRANQRVPDHHVPSLLDWWSRQPKRSEVIFAAMGPRAAWLAQLNHDWHKPIALADVPPNADDLWQTGTAPERTALLTTIRRHDPARALALVQSTWSSDGADERARFAIALTANRSMADESFLESALDDRAKTVRRAAAAVLTRIQGSRLRARLAALARTIITVEREKKLLRGSKVKITLTPPKDYDKAWERDAIEEQPPGNAGKRAWWARQILSAADLNIWHELSGLDDPAAIIDAIDDDDRKDAIEALRIAATNSAAAAWAAPITHAILKQDPKQAPTLRPLWEPLSPLEREQLLTEVLKSYDMPLDLWLTTLTAHTSPWSIPFSTAFLEKLKEQVRRKTDNAWYYTGALDSVITLIAPQLVDAFEHALTQVFSDESANTIQKFTDRLRLRAEMHKEFLS